MRKKNNSFKAIQGYEGKILAQYAYRISVHSKLLQTIKSILPASLSTHALHCVVSERKVSLYTDSAAWSSQLRFYHQAMLKAITSSNQGNFETIQIKIIPKTTQLDNKEKPILPSTANINSLLGQAENQTDETLKVALLNLGNTLKKSNKRNRS